MILIDELGCHMKFTNISYGDQFLKNEYWEDYYRHENAPLIPSQFAVFAMNEYPEIRTVVDIGCGNGRDSFFFAAHIKRVLGFDGSEAAIEACEQRKAALGISHLSFVNSDVSNLAETIAPLLANESPPIMLYSRFLLHSLTADQEEILIHNVRSILRKTSGIFIAEFRTVKDSDLRKETAPHFRRFVNPSEFLGRCRQHSLQPTYFVEGTGFAKYRRDDAHVARVILQLNTELVP